MRTTRLLISILALALLGLVPAASSASAVGPSSESSAVSSRLAPAAPVTSARVRKLSAKIVKRRNGNLIMTGVIRPAKGPVLIQRATSCNRRRGTCNFKSFATTKVNNRGRYTLRVSAPRTGSWAWRAKKNATVSDIWLTCKQRPGQSTCPTP